MGQLGRRVVIAQPTELVRWGSVEPEDILRQSLARCREAKGFGATTKIIVGRVVVAADGTQSFDVFYSSMFGHEMLWLAKQIEKEALAEEEE